MLDFYTINYEDNTPDYPNEDNYIGSISLEEYKLLEELISYLKMNGVNITHFNDFRLKSEDIKLLSFFVKSFLMKKATINKEKKEIYTRLNACFSKVENRGGEILCFCD